MLVLMAAPAPAAAKPKPGLKVRSVEIDNPEPSEPLHMFNETNDSLDAHVQVKNVGKAAGKGNGVLSLQGNGALSPAKLKFPVPKLKPGKTKTIDLLIIVSDLPGTTDYATKGCVGKSCHAGPNFAVIPFRWRGTTQSVVDDNGIVSTCNGNVTFKYDHAASGNATFIYRATGFVNCIASGMQGGCTFSGGGEDIAIEESLTTLQISSSLNSYNATGASSMSYEALKECKPDPPTVENIDVTAWLTTGNFAMDPVDTTLSGSLPLEGSTWSWNLSAATI